MKIPETLHKLTLTTLCLHKKCIPKFYTACCDSLSINSSDLPMFELIMTDSKNTLLAQAVKTFHLLSIVTSIQALHNL